MGVSNAGAAPVKYIYECSGLGGVDEYRVAIHLKLKQAEFFDNDQDYTMNYVRTILSKKAPYNQLMVFEGIDRGINTILQLTFDPIFKRVNLLSIQKYPGKTQRIGSASCKNIGPHDWEW